MSELSTPSIASNPQPPPRRPRVREVSSRFMSPSVSTPKHPPPSTVNSLRRSQTDFRPRYADENRSDSVNRTSVSPARCAVKLFKDPSRPDTPAPVPAPAPSRGLRQPVSETAASRLLRMSSDSHNGLGDSEEMRVSCEWMNTRKGGVRRPPVPLPVPGGSKGGENGAGEVKMAVRKGKGSSSVEDVHRLKMLYNHYINWRFVNAKSEACMINQKKQSEKQLYSMAVKISELQESVKRKRIELGILKQMRILSTTLDSQMPHLDEWSFLEESYSSSLHELSNGLLNVVNQLPLVGNVRADMKEIEEALHSAMKTAEMICNQVQTFMPKAENVDRLISDVARVCSGEITLVDECGELLSKTHLSQVEECSLKVQLMQLHQLQSQQA